MYTKKPDPSGANRTRNGIDGANGSTGSQVFFVKDVINNSNRAPGQKEKQEGSVLTNMNGINDINGKDGIDGCQKYPAPNILSDLYPNGCIILKMIQ